MTPDLPTTPPEIVAEHVSGALKASSCVTWVVDQVLQKPWSTIYFLSCQQSGVQERIIAKITRTPEQRDFRDSWRSPELLERGVRESQCLQEVAEHFKSAPSDLQSLEPVGYIPSINAVLTRYVAGHSIWHGALHPRRLFNPRSAVQAEQILQQAGHWLRWLHAIQRLEPGEPRKSYATDALRALREYSQQLLGWGVDVHTWQNWQPALKKLETVSIASPVWLHGDFHPGNLWVLPDQRLLCFDTALERFGSPYEDLGKFTAALKSRRFRVFSAGRFPSEQIIQRLESALLNGYHRGEPVDHLSLQLFEGRYLFQKWLEMLAALVQKTPPGTARLLAYGMIHPAFKCMLRSWINRVYSMR